ncbi:hypothetical protein BURMUCGD1_4979 [Burkholderia multivorans CGD1]|nr:hypothetical protein BURMUCGD1_4979 [Burkholderia multivorans CGD1]
MALDQAANDAHRAAFATAAAHRRSVVERCAKRANGVPHGHGCAS